MADTGQHNLIRHWMMATETLPPNSKTERNTFERNPTHGFIKTEIPVVRCLITEEDVGPCKKTAVQSLSLVKVVKLLTDPHSARLCERHFHALKKVVKHYKNGFIMKDLVLVFKILNICADKVSDIPSYAEPMSELLHLCSFPYLKEKTSDEMSYEQIAIESIDQLGYLMRVPDRNLRLQICDTLKKFYCTEQNQQMVEKYKSNSVTYNQRLVEKSDVAETLIKSLALVADDLEVRHSVLDLLLKLSRKSELNCKKILNGDGAFRLCSHLLDYDPSQKVLFLSVEILWNLLENGLPELLIKQLNSVKCISQLRDAFIQQMMHGVGHADCQLRNDLLVVASLIASICPDAPFVETGFAKQLVLFASHEEVKSHNVLVKHLKLAPNQENFELKKLLFNIMVQVSKNPAAIPILSEGHVIVALFSYVKSNEIVRSAWEWNPAQYEEIQLQAMATLSTLAPLMIEDYLSCQGSTRLLLLLEWCISSDSYAGFGNGYHAVGGCGSKRAQLRHCLRLIRSIVSTYNEAVLIDLTEQGAISQLVSVLEGCITKHSQEKDLQTEDAVDIEMQTDILVIIAILCQHDISRKELFGTEGVSILVEFLKMDIGFLASGLGHFGLVVSVVNCIWCAVVGCYLTEDYFLEKEGTFLLLDLLQLAPRSLHSQILGCFLDLSENQKTLSHIGVWRGKKNVSTAHLLCEIWRREEEHIGVKRDTAGAIADTQKPLLGQLQDSQAVISLPASCPSQAIVDVSENLRAKIYAIFNKIGFVDLPGLTAEDHITLTIIEHYLNLKVGEVWTEVISELAEECIRPITPDREAMEAISSAIRIRTEQIVQVQKDLLEVQAQQDLINEQEYYAEVRERHRQKEKVTRNFAEFVSRTSNYMMLKAAKERQELSIDTSRVHNYKTSANFHSINLPNTNVTVFSGRSVAVHTTPAAVTGGILTNSDPLSGTDAKAQKLYDQNQNAADDETLQPDMVL